MPTSHRSSGSRVRIEIHRGSRIVAVPARRIREVLSAVLSDETVSRAELSVAIVNDAAIHRVNAEHLGHDYPTDVISFLYSAAPNQAQSPKQKSSRRRGADLVLEGELIVSDETALREAGRQGWSPEAELLLYLVHGLLHLCGYDDLTTSERRIMKRRERELAALLELK